MLGAASDVLPTPVGMIPSLDPRDYGHETLGDLISAVDLFETERRPTPSGKATAIYLQDKRRQSDEK